MRNKPSPGINSGIRSHTKEFQVKWESLYISLCKKESSKWSNNTPPTLIYTQCMGWQSQGWWISQILLIKILMRTNYSRPLVHAAKVISLDSKTKLLIILELTRNIRTNFSARRLYGNSCWGSWKLTFIIVQVNSQKFQPSQMLQKGLNKMKISIRVEATPVAFWFHRIRQETTLLGSHPLPTFVQGKQTLYPQLQEKDWKSQHFSCETAFWGPAGRLWLCFLTLLSLNFLISKMG